MPLDFINHAIAIYTLLLAPLLGWFRYRSVKRSVAAGEQTAKNRMFARVVASQLAITLVICALWFVRGVPRASLGLGAPYSWWLSAGVALTLLAVFALSAVKLRAKAALVREKLSGRAGAMIPETVSELRWFGAVSFGSGIAEELAYRGFWFYYLHTYAPRLNTIEVMVITSLIFGVGHIYQGLKGVGVTALAGLIMATLFVATGNLLVPMVVHSAGNMRALIIFWPQKEPAK